MTNPCTSVRYDARYSCGDVCRLSRLIPNQHIDLTLAIVNNIPSETRTTGAVPPPAAAAAAASASASASAAARLQQSCTEHRIIDECTFFDSIANSRTYRQELSDRSRTETINSDRRSDRCIVRYGERCNQNLIRLSDCCGLENTNAPWNSVQCVCTSVSSNRTDSSNHKCIKQRNFTIETDGTSEHTVKQTLCDIRHFVMSVLSRAATNPVRAGHWLLLSTVILAISFPTLADAQILNASKLAPSKESGICNSVDIRNSIDEFDKLSGCRVVEGYIQILLFDKTDESAYENKSFPLLTEITDYLLLYRVNGLSTLGKLFPNLTVIRGQRQFFNYALVVFEMNSLQEIGLYSLTDIVHGLVRIDKNPSLCYVNTIDWDLIAKEGKGGEHFIKSNKLENECPICPGDDGNDEGIVCPKAQHIESSTTGLQAGRHLCWNRQKCQKVCPKECTDQDRTCNEKGECCAEYCLGGCKSEPGDCVVCKQLSIGDGNAGRRQCANSCPAEMYEFLNRRCITKNDCLNMKIPVDIENGKRYKAFNGSCLQHCPPNYYEVDGLGHYPACKPCQGMCRKECKGANVDSILSAQNLRGCTHIKGSLEIQIRGGRNVVKELEDNLNMIEIIDGYLKIVRSFPLISLGFLKNLREINGKHLESGKYALVVLDNQNLQELWDWEVQKNHTLKIRNGRFFFHFNPKLCISKIERLGTVVQMNDFSELEVAKNSNGDKVACNVTELKVNVSQIQAAAVILSWDPFVLNDHRSLLGYVVHSIEAPYQNVTLYDGRDGCGGDGWRVDDVASDLSESPVFHLLTQLKPYTQYAFYVRTYTIATERSGAQSVIDYFRTKPAKPSVPMRLTIHAVSHSKLVIKWEPPMHPNGNVAYYLVNANCTSEHQEYFQQRDYCKEPLTQVPEKETPVVVKPDETSEKSTNESCACDSAENNAEKVTKKDERERVSQINFEDELHNRVYIKREEEQDIMRRKREIYMDQAKKRYTADKHLHSTTVAAEQVTKNETETQYSNSSCIAMKHKIRGLTTFVMENLPHFTKYTIYVQACRAKEQVDDNDFCSTASIVTTRTLRSEGVDNVGLVRVSIPSANLTSGMVKLMWDEPEDPNGIILTYQIEYRRVDIENIKPMIECVTRQEFLDKKKEYILKDLPAGNYSVRLMATSLAGNGEFTPYNYFFIEEVKSGSTTEIIVGVVITIVLLTCALGVMLYLRRKYMSNVPNMKLIASVNPEYVSTAYVPDDWEVPRKKIELLRELGQGSFGMVYEGIARDVVKGKPEIRCAIKTVNEHATDRERIEFLNEASVMKAFDTTHVVRLLGVVSQGQPTLVVMELMANGDLKSYLRSHRPDTESYNSAASRQPPTLKRIFQMAIEIADGMAYLAAKKFVHRDLAARNCMVAEDLTVKIGDFGMTRDIYETDYYRKGTKGLLPVRWMAPESLKDGVFTSNSDVWSYGVVLWEMATLASQPYQGLSNDQVLRYVIDGGIMERPENCPDKLYNLMRVCWQHKPSLRPAFLSLASMLLEDACPNFKLVSFYHSTAGVEARNIHNPSQDDPSTPLRLTKDIEDFSLGSGTDPDSEPEDLVDDVPDSDFDDKRVTINFPGYQGASFKGNQKSLDTSGPSLYSYKDNDRSQDTSGPSFGSYSEQPRLNDSRSMFTPRDHIRSVESLHSGTGRESLLKESEGSGSAEANTTVNGYVVGRASANNTAVKTTQC